MNCPNCGMKLGKGQAFCGACGTPLPPKPETKKNPLLLPVILLCVLLLLSAAGNALLLLTAPEEEPKIEGEGFETPEEAITAYAEAMAAGDVEAMFATFAIESLAETFSMKERAEHFRSYTPYSNDITLPENGEYVRQLNVYSRLSHLIPHVRNGYYVLVGLEEGESVYAIREDDEDGTLKQLLKTLEFDDFDETLAELEIGDVLDADDFDCDDEILEKMQENYDYLNVDELKDLAIELTFDGEDYWLFMLTAEIDGRWYNITPMSPLATLVGMPAVSGGMTMQE